MTEEKERICPECGGQLFFKDRSAYSSDGGYHQRFCLGCEDCDYEEDCGPEDWR